MLQWLAGYLGLALVLCGVAHGCGVYFLFFGDFSGIGGAFILVGWLGIGLSFYGV